jgi:hypothetical protein
MFQSLLRSPSLSAFLAAWLIAAACVGTLALLQGAVPGIESLGRIDPARPSSARGVPWAPSRDLMFEGSAAGKEPVTILP